MQDFADRSAQVLRLGILQATAGVPIPPAAGQAFLYDYDAELGTFLQSDQLGPTALRSTQTIGAGRLAVRFASSYFELNETFRPVAYQATGGPIPPDLRVFSAFGALFSANAVLFNAAVTYGFTDRIEATVNIPFSVVDTQGAQTFLTAPPPFVPPNEATVRGVVASPGETGAQAVNRAIASGNAAYRTLSFSSLGADFSDGKNVGLGRISVGAKGLVLASDRADLALSGEFFCNSPSENEFAGSNSPSVLPRAIGQVRVARHLNLLADAGYEYDFDVDQLSRFVWNAGLSVPVVNATFDFGVGGSLFDESIVALPPTLTGGEGVMVRAVDPDALDLGRNYVDLLFGVKMALFGTSVLSGAVSVPVTDDGMQPDAAGTVALEYYF